MARTKQDIEGGVRLSDHLALCSLAEFVPLDEVERVLAAAGKETKRQRKLPRELLVYYVIAMALYSHVNQLGVLKALLQGLGWISPEVHGPPAGEAAISQGREHLGDEVMKRLFATVCKPLATARTRGGWYRSWRLMAIDASHFDLPDEQQIVKEYPKHSNGAEYPFPQLRFAALVELGTHCICAAAPGNDHHSEKQLAVQLLPQLQPDMLLLGDRYYLGYDLLARIEPTGARVLFRAKANFALKPRAHLPDGSYQAKLYADHKDRRRDGGKTVRVIEYRVSENGTPTGERCRLVTNILDWQQAPAAELARLYCERWGIEAVFDEIKNHLKLPGHTLRSKRPDLIRQEFWGYLLAHYVIRAIMLRAAEANDLDADDLSFTETVEIVRRRSASGIPFPPPASASAPPLG